MRWMTQAMTLPSTIPSREGVGVGARTGWQKLITPCEGCGRVGEIFAGQLFLNSPVCNGFDRSYFENFAE